MRLLGRGFYTLIWNAPTDMRSHNPSSLEASVIPFYGMLHSPLQQTWDLTIYPPWRPSVILLYGMLRSPLQQMWDLTIHPPSRPSVVPLYGMLDSHFHPCGISQSTVLGGPVHSLAHHLVSDFDIICNDHSPPLVVLFGLSFLGFPSRF